MATAAINQSPIFQAHMKGPFVSSLIFHVVVIVIMITGMPYLKSEVPTIDESIAVEIVDMDEIKDERATKREEVKRQPPKNEVKPAPRKSMPKVTSIKPSTPSAPDKIEEYAPPEPEKKVPAPVKKPEPIKAKTPPKPIKSPVTKEEEPEQEKEFNSLLKNLMDSEQQQAIDDKNKSSEPSPLQRFSQNMSISELGTLRAQLNRCWSVLAGARYAEDLIIELKLFVNPNRSIRDVKVVNQLRYNTDSFYKAAADSAIRAVYRCSPLDVPPQKYELWKTITVTFDPRKVL